MAHPYKRAKWSTATFVVAFAVTLFLLVWISRGFLMPLVLAASGAVLLAPWNEKLIRKMDGRRRLASLLMAFATFAVILAPLTYIVVRMVQELVPFVSHLAKTLGTGEFSTRLAELLPEHLQQSINAPELRKEIQARLAAVATGLAAFATTLPAAIANVLIDAFVGFLALYVYFARGPRIVDAIVEATPMERRHTRRLLETIGATIQAVFAASFITAVIQFALGWIAFFIVGVPYALPLAALMAFFSFIFSLVPVLGSGLVWGPVGVGLLVGGRPIAGIFVLGWGLLVLGSVDNVVKPLYAKGALALSPLLVFVTLFGGIAVLGPIGALLGPLIAALAAAFLRIWTTEFLEDARALPRRIVMGKKRRRVTLLSRLRRHRHA